MVKKNTTIFRGMLVSLTIVLLFVSIPIGMADPQINICHRDQGSPVYKEKTIDANALDAHLHHQWGADIYPVPVGGCPTLPTPPVPELPTSLLMSVGLVGLIFISKRKW